MRGKNKSASGDRSGKGPTSPQNPTLADRLRDARVERYGEHGVPELARQLGVPPLTWLDYEAGVMIPAEVLLLFIEVSGVEVASLMGMPGPMVRTEDPGATDDGV